jgi:hypothetical protein
MNVSKPSPPGPRFWSKVARMAESNGGHWFWQGYINPNGYGYFQVAGRKSKPEPTHRVAWQLAGRVIPSGHTLRNLCGERSCVNPDHWDITTVADTRRRAIAKRKENA